MPDRRILYGTSFSPDPGDRAGGDDGVTPPAVPVGGDHPTDDHGWGGNAALVVVIALELTFNLLARSVQHLNEAQSLEELIGPTSLGVVVIHGKSILLTIGHRLAVAFGPGRGVG